MAAEGLAGLSLIIRKLHWRNNWRRASVRDRGTPSTGDRRCSDVNDNGGVPTAPLPYLLDEEDPIDVIIDLEPEEPTDPIITQSTQQDPSSSSHSPPLPKASITKKTYTKTLHPSRITSHSHLERKGPTTRSQVARLAQSEMDRPSLSPLGEGMED